YFLLLLFILKNQTRRIQEDNNERFFNSTVSNLDNNEKELSTLEESFHENNNIMLDNLLLSFSGGKFNDLESMSTERQSDLLFSATATMYDCVCLSIVDSRGNIYASDIAGNVGLNLITDSDFGLTEESFLSLCDGSEDYLVVANPYRATEGTDAKQAYLYCRKIPGSGSGEKTLYITLGITSGIIDAATERLSDLSGWLNASTIGTNGAAFMVDSANDLVKCGTLLGVDETGKNASAAGFSPAILKDRYTGIAGIDGVKCYISVRAYSSELYGADQYIVAAIPVRDLYSVNYSVIVWNVCLFLIIVLLIVAYSSFVRTEVLKKNEDLKKFRLFSVKNKNLYFSRNLAGRILPVVIASALLLFLFAFYFQTLMKLSDAFSESVAIENEIKQNVEESAKLQDDFLYYYDYQYESRARLMAFIVASDGDKYFDYENEQMGVNPVGNVDGSGNKDPLLDDYRNPVYCISNSESLKKLCDINSVKNIYLISDSGYTMATSSSYWNFSLSSDPKDQSYEFWDILNGKKDAFVQDAMISDEGNMSRFIGCAMYYYTRLGEDGNTEYLDFSDYYRQMNGSYDGNEITRHLGLLQFEMDPKEESNVIDSAKPEYILSNTRISNDGFLIGFKHKEEEEDDYYVFYSPIASMTDKKASELGFSEKAFSGNYNGFQTLYGKNYLQSFRQAGDYYIATAMPMDSLYYYSFYTSLFCALFALLVMLILTSFVIFIGDMDSEELYREETDPMAIFGHWQTSWKKNYSPSRNFEIIIKNSLILLGIVFLAAIFLEACRFGNNSAILYIIGGEWDRGVHIFSLSACVVIIILSVLALKAFGHIVCLIAAAFGNRMITMMRLFVSLIRAAAVVIVILFCLYLMGIDATSLLASAGIMSVVVGLGAQSLVGDLLAGIFMVMEDSIHVGDYIVIDGIRGKITEIGLRITRYEDDNQNIRIICNNEMKAFANMSMKYSLVFYNIPVPYGEDYPKIKKLLNSEFLELYEAHPFLKSIPVCQGIENFGDSSVELRVKFMCEEAERFDVQRFMHDEIMRIFTENGIEIPFNQIDVHFDRELSGPEREEK
ncbi:MAG: mechanosensitive ion channel family protein, partial [Lachnospiraceae bacterium]|nr:mechanosensitive ion channel family protein [Lachnospiraceae bacterium]